MCPENQKIKIFNIQNNEIPNNNYKINFDIWNNNAILFLLFT